MQIGAEMSEKPGQQSAGSKALFLYLFLVSVITFANSCKP
jgi:hypothetical protein